MCVECRSCGEVCVRVKHGIRRGVRVCVWEGNYILTSQRARRMGRPHAPLALHFGGSLLPPLPFPRTGRPVAGEHIAPYRPGSYSAFPAPRSPGRARRAHTCSIWNMHQADEEHGQLACVLGRLAGKWYVPWIPVPAISRALTLTLAHAR